MSLRSVATRAVEVLLVVALVSLVAGAALGQPVLLSYVETGSMEPTVGAGDGFVAVPSVVAGEPEVGEVVVFRAEQLHGGGLTTHRIVDETEQGYVTKGDANPFTDQDGGEPPVTEDRIVAEALQIGDTVIVVPFLGTAIGGIQGAVLAVQHAVAGALGMDALLGPQGVGLVLFGIGLALFVLSFALDAVAGPSRDRRRSRAREGVVDTRLIAVVLLLVVLLPSTIAMVVPSGVHEMPVDGDDVAAQSDLEPGDLAVWEYDVANRGIVPVVVVFDSEDESVHVPQVTSVLGPGEASTLTVGVEAPPPGERYTGTARESHYLLVLPPSVIAALHDLHPVVAWVVIDALLAASLLGLVARPLGLGRVRLRGSGGVSLGTRLRRRFG